MDKVIKRILTQEEQARLERIKRSNNKSTCRWVKNILLDLGRNRFNLPLTKEGSQ